MRFALLALLLSPVAALGQGFSRPPGVPPSVTPANYRPVPFYAPPVGYYGYYPGYGGGGFGYGYGYGPGYFGPGYSSFTTLVPAPLTPPPAEGTKPAVVGTAPAADPADAGTLTIEFPAGVTLTVNGKPEPGTGAVRTVTGPPLKAGGRATLALAADWTQGGKRFTWTRAVSLGRGDASRLTVARGVAAD